MQATSVGSFWPSLVLIPWVYVGGTLNSHVLEYDTGWEMPEDLLLSISDLWARSMDLGISLHNEKAVTSQQNRNTWVKQTGKGYVSNLGEVQLQYNDYTNILKHKIHFQ